MLQCILIFFYFKKGNGVGSGTEQINICYGVYVDANGTVYYSDFVNNRIMKKSNASTPATVIAGSNGIGSALNQFNGPTGIYMDVNNAAILYIADSINNRIQKWIIGNTSGSTVAGGNSLGLALNQLNNPMAVISDSYENLYISDTNNHRIMMWTIGASSGTVIAGISGVIGITATTLNLPLGITLDKNYSLYVADSANFRVQKFMSWW